MLQISQIKLRVEHTEADLRRKVEKELELKRILKNTPSFQYKILRKSIDARKKPEIFYIYTVIVAFTIEYNLNTLTISEAAAMSISKANSAEHKIEETILSKCRSKNVTKYNPAIYEVRDVNNTPKLNNILNNKNIKRPVVIGEGPCGLFAGLTLAKAGLKPIIIERGDKVEIRVDKVENFWLTGSVDENSNVQFGEGGAGAFSDGKLNTLVKDKTGKNQYVLDTFVRFGAKESVAYDAKPHVGTDILRDVVRDIREEIIRLGGDVYHNQLLTDLDIKDGKVVSINVDNLVDGSSNTFGVSDVILAVGHSARDLFKTLSKAVTMEQKNFAIGIRIQHPQAMIDNSQYGKGHSDELPPSPYKLTNHTSNGRDVFSFCMCPGGYVVAATSEKGKTCVNGMSYSDRASENANSALIVAIDRKDFGSEEVLAGVELQNKLETCAFNIGKGQIPVQLFKDFKNNVASTGFGDVNPQFKGNTEFANLREIFPEEISVALIESIEKFGYTIEGFACDDAILAAVESRTSSPVRIVRDENLESSVKGLYPAGEGAGYAGGIMSAAMDGIRVADKIIDKYLAL